MAYASLYFSSSSSLALDAHQFQGVQAQLEARITIAHSCVLFYDWKGEKLVKQWKKTNVCVGEWVWPHTCTSVLLVEVKQYRAPLTPGHSEVYMIFDMCEVLHKCHLSTFQRTTLHLRAFCVTGCQDWQGLTMQEAWSYLGGMFNVECLPISTWLAYILTLAHLEQYGSFCEALYIHETKYSAWMLYSTPCIFFASVAWWSLPVISKLTLKKC